MNTTEKAMLVSRGDTVKYKVEITHADFNQANDNYRVELSWGVIRHTMTIEKSDMVVDEDGNAFLIFDTDCMLGWVKASCYYDVEDSDAPDGYRTEVNYQWLCFVSSEPTVKFGCDVEPGGDGHVVYTRVYGGDVNTAYLNLRDSEQQNLMDSEGNQLRVHKAPEDYQDN